MAQHNITLTITDVVMAIQEWLLKYHQANAQTLLFRYRQTQRYELYEVKALLKPRRRMVWLTHEPPENRDMRDMVEHWHGDFYRLRRPVDCRISYFLLCGFPLGEEDIPYFS